MDSDGIAAADDELLFADEFADEESGEGELAGRSTNWKILLVDDEHSVHDVTTLTLGDFRFEGRKVEFLHAYSGEEAKQVMADNPDVAMILLDVVMEDDHAGLKVVEFVRNQLNNHFTRIILRTGQPGQAPEAEVINAYDINDYKEKTELTVQKLRTTVITTLRSYQSTMQLEKSRHGLQKIVDATASVFKIKSMEYFVEGVLAQIVAMTSCKNAFCALDGSLAEPYNASSGACKLLAGIGSFADSTGQNLNDVVEGEVLRDLELSIARRENLFFDHGCVVFIEGTRRCAGVLYLAGDEPVDETERNLIELFGHNISIALDNIDLNSDLQHTQEHVIHLLGTVSEFHSQETSLHVKRVGRYTARLAELYGLPKEEVDLLENAAPLHDVGKVGISDLILSKPGRLTEDEMEEMKQHTSIGYEILRKNENRPVLLAASTIAHQHHEKWDGSGYPRGLKGEEIHLYGRMSAVADVFDALASKRCYKEAWSMEEIRRYFENEEGKHFDPHLTGLLLRNFSDFVEIFELLSD